LGDGVKHLSAKQYRTATPPCREGVLSGFPTIHQKSFILLVCRWIYGTLLIAFEAQFLNPHKNREWGIDLDGIRIEDLAVEFVRRSFANQQLVDFGAPARSNQSDPYRDKQTCCCEPFSGSTIIASLQQNEISVNSMGQIRLSQAPNAVIEDSTIDGFLAPIYDVESVPSRSVVEKRMLR
jgi:hypothetical protein